MAAAVGFVAGVVIAMVVRETLRARTSPAQAPGSAASVENTRAVAPAEELIDLGAVARTFGFVLIMVAGGFGVGATVTHLAHALPLHEIGTRSVPGVVAALAGLVLIALGSIGRQRQEQPRFASPTAPTSGVVTDAAATPTWLDAA
jgi:Na+/glutamate symporter